MKMTRLRNGSLIPHTRYELLRYIVSIHDEKSRAESEALHVTEWAVIAYEEMTGNELGWKRLCDIDTDRWKRGVYRRQRERKHQQLTQREREYQRAEVFWDRIRKKEEAAFRTSRARGKF